MRLQGGTIAASKLIADILAALEKRQTVVIVRSSDDEAELHTSDVHWSVECDTPGCDWGHNSDFPTADTMLTALEGHLATGHQPRALPVRAYWMPATNSWAVSKVWQ